MQDIMNELNHTESEEQDRRDEKTNQGPDTIQTSLGIFTGTWGKGLQTKALKCFLKMTEHHCSSTQ